MSSRVVGEPDRTLGRWIDGGDLVATGSAWARYSRIVADVIEYMQADFSFAALLYEFPLTLAADGFERFFVWPSSAAGWTITETARHSIHGFSEDSVEHDVRMPEEVGFTAADRTILARILAKPTGGGGGGGIAMVGPDRRQTEQIVKDTAAAVRKQVDASNAEQTRHLDKQFDALKDLSEEQVRQQVDESNAAQTAELLDAIGSLETAEGAAARAGRAGAAAEIRFDGVEASIRDVRAITERAEQSAEAARASAEIVAAREISAGREVVEADQAPRFAEIERRIDALGDQAREISAAQAEQRNIIEATLRELEAERAAALQARDRETARASTLDAQIRAIRKDSAAAAAIGAKTDDRAKSIAGGVKLLLKRGA